MRTNYSVLVDDPEKFYISIPTNLIENIKFRQKLHEILASDSAAQKTYLQLCVEKPQIAFNSLFFTYNPRKPAGMRNYPFILRPAQDEAVVTLKEGIDKGFDIGVNKSRDEGATEIIAKLYILYFLTVPETAFLVGSRKEEYVDKTGDPKTIFAKMDYALKHLPNWMQPVLERNHLHIGNKVNSSVIDGEATNENFGAGARATSVMLDEFGRVEVGLAKNIRDSIADVSNCIIYNSTHFYGAGHPFSQLLHSQSVKVVLLPFYRNPEKNYGLYKSPRPNIIEIIDIDYYRKVCPQLFTGIQPNVSIGLTDLEKQATEKHINLDLVGIHFVADGCENIPGDLRSPWHDEQEKRRTKRDLSQNVWMCPIGSADMFFDAAINDRIRSSVIKSPQIKGELEWIVNSQGKILPFSVLFKEKGHNRLWWWGGLKNDRPDQTHNYIIGCDISVGTGESNSVAAVYDVNTQELIGLYVNPNIGPEPFADYTIALAYWVGGINTPLIVWEKNGGHGTNYGRRLLAHGYNHLYRTAKEGVKTRKVKSEYGWFCNIESKEDMLTQLRSAVEEGLKTQRKYKSIIIYDEGLVDELDNYIYYENRDIGFSGSADENSGARMRHGDKVVGAGLCILGLKEQTKGSIKSSDTISPFSVGGRRLRHQQNLRQRKDEWKDNPDYFG